MQTQEGNRYQQSDTFNPGENPLVPQDVHIE
jgi:hypothetical protein